MRHFHDSHFGGNPLRVNDYIHYEHLSWRFFWRKTPAEANEFLPTRYQGIGPTRFIVLIDEIDKEEALCLELGDKDGISSKPRRVQLGNSSTQCPFTR